MPLDPHHVLGLAPDATLDEAEDAYHRLLRQEHPDLHHNAGPERVARAERRTRDLNAAISALRDADSVRAGARTGPSRASQASGASGAASRSSGTGTDDDDAGEWSDPPEPTSSAPCPWCGDTFTTAVALKDHVFAHHDLRLDRRVRGGLFGGRIHRLTQAAAHLPLWGVIPLNLAVALPIGLLAAVPTNETVGRWAFAIVMAPSVIKVVDRAFDLSR